MTNPSEAPHARGRAAVRDSWRPRDTVAILGARATARAVRLVGRGGTSLPGMVAELLAPGVLSRLARRLDAIALVSGTNGKTSTARLLTHILEQTGHGVVVNRSGANLRQAITSALVARAAASGRRRRPGSVGVFEVDEAALPSIVRALPHPLLVTTNLFRDQLDRFGETDYLVRLWRAVLDELPPGARVAYCADDPRLAALVHGRPITGVGFGLAGPPPVAAVGSVTGDVSACPRCGSSLAYAWSAAGHLGEYDCSRCGFHRPTPWLAVRVVRGHGLAGQTLGFRWPDAEGERLVEIRLPGLGNAYNAAAAVTAAAVLGVAPETAITALAGASVPFGRFEELGIDGRRVVLALVKNPASLAELTRIGVESAVDTVLFALNDAFADGRDVSWYWDASPAAMLRDHVFVVSGRRAADFVLRLRYDLLDDRAQELRGLVATVDPPAEGLARAVAATPVGGTVFVIATYTALLGLRAGLVERGLVPAMPR